MLLNEPLRLCGRSLRNELDRDGLVSNLTDPEPVDTGSSRTTGFRMGPPLLGLLDSRVAGRRTERLPEPRFFRDIVPLRTNIESLVEWAGLLCYFEDGCLPPYLKTLKKKINNLCNKVCPKSSCTHEISELMNCTRL